MGDDPGPASCRDFFHPTSQGSPPGNVTAEQAKAVALSHMIIAGGQLDGRMGVSCWVRTGV